MMFVDELYQQTVADNEKNLRFWENYLNSLKSLDLSVYAEKLKVPTLVPVGSRVFFRGELKHTNEVTVSLGADYFAKCSLKQAEVLRQHRIKDAESKLDIFIKEKEYLENQLSLTRQNIYHKDGQEIVENYTEEEEIAWRKKHRENVRKYKQEKAKENKGPKDENNDNELWERFEELELQEELENEMLDNYNEIVDKRKENSLVINEQNLLLNSLKKEINQQQSWAVTKDPNEQNENKINTDKLETLENISQPIPDEPKESSKLELLQQVLDKQNELENKLHELKYREREQSRTKQELISKLEELEKLDELEDEIYRLDDILETKDVESEESESSQSESTKSKKSICFQDDDSATIEIAFTHSATEPSSDGYDPEKGITKPSDIYDAYPHFFVSKTTSILKKSKYDLEDKEMLKQTKQIKCAESVDDSESPEIEDTTINKTIVINDVVEKPERNQKKVEMGARPTSLFKKRRLQNKA